VPHTTLYSEFQFTLEFHDLLIRFAYLIFNRSNFITK